MKNLKEKLEIMQWLFDQGIKPNMVYSHHGHASITLEDYEYWDEEILPDCEGDLFKSSGNPWYPLEQVLGLLPESIQKSGVDCRLMFDGLLNLLGYRSAWGYYAIMESKPIDCIDFDYHLAALKLLKKVIEKYPEQVSKGIIIGSKKAEYVIHKCQHMDVKLLHTLEVSEKKILRDWFFSKIEALRMPVKKWWEFWK